MVAMTNNRGVLRSMPDKSQICVCLSNYEHHRHKRSWDIIVLYFPTITVNIRHIQLHEAGYLMLISVFIFSFFISFFFFGVDWPGANLEGENVRGHGVVPYSVAVIPWETPGYVTSVTCSHTSLESTLRR